MCFQLSFQKDVFSLSWAHCVHSQWLQGMEFFLNSLRLSSHPAQKEVNAVIKIWACKNKRQLLQKQNKNCLMNEKKNPHPFKIPQRKVTLMKVKELGVRMQNPGQTFFKHTVLLLSLIKHGSSQNVPVTLIQLNMFFF